MHCGALTYQVGFGEMLGYSARQTGGGGRVEPGVAADRRGIMALRSSPSPAPLAVELRRSAAIIEVLHEQATLYTLTTIL